MGRNGKSKGRGMKEGSSSVRARSVSWLHLTQRYIYIYICCSISISKWRSFASAVHVSWNADLEARRSRNGSYDSTMQPHFPLYLEQVVRPYLSSKQQCIESYTFPMPLHHSLQTNQHLHHIVYFDLKLRHHLRHLPVHFHPKTTMMFKWARWMTMN